MYQALYRKYRPSDFDSVVGQETIVKTLKNSIIHKNFSHAYLFFGPRGVGKTSLSKIFARNVNCLDPIDGNACGKCEACNYSFSSNCVDIIEIDAASNNGVDEIRDLKNKIALVPSQLKYKVYIIDEVHMLSIGAFNALLKTLEEPPAHVIFILATTDPQKVPETIISRCQCFSFKKLSSDTIEKRLEFVCEKDNIEVELDVLKAIAILSDGGMRDALGSLDKLLSYSNDKITMDIFTELNGILSDKDLYDFLKSIINGDFSYVIKSLNEFDFSGKNLLQILNQLLNYCRNLIVDFYLDNKSLDISLDLLQKFSDLLNEKMFDIKKSSNTKIYIELFLLKFMNENCSKTNLDVYSFNKNIVESYKDSNIMNIDFQEKEDFNKNMVKKSNNNNENDVVAEDNSLDFNPKILNIDEIMKIRINNTLALASKDLLNKELLNFEKLKDFTFDENIGYIVCSILDSKIRVVSPENILISFEYDSNVEQNLSIILKIIDVYNKITGSNKNIAIISDSAWEKIREEYINNLHNHIKYQIQEEPKLIFEEINNNDIISNSAIDLFGDIVEID